MELTLVIFHYLRDELLERCLDAVKENTGEPYRVVVMEEQGERQPIGVKKSRILEHVDTPFFTKLDNDMVVYPYALDLQLLALKTHPCLAACSGVILQNGKLPKHIGAANLSTIGKYLVRSRDKTSKLEGLMFYDMIPEGATTYRTEAFRDVSFDLRFDIGYSHWDTVTQFWKSRWRTAIHSGSIIDHRHPKKDTYCKWKTGNPLILESRRKYIEKWGLRPVEYNERSIPGMVLHGLVTLKEKLQ